ncbi:crossover junction endodeoxyribonuclease RuvC [Cytobacillus oceanisediminis]|uniref:crossover junction endodeoxyribonuclease RuvC n=1 Tax=Cytobacillus oceanisediminis TaxID=665099 RepID=UPI001FB2FB79|nr:crossover junction endodeoxyribonuclease RuvC [Cytobacillus oceanisediminis]UOE58207.1 crossover junction endodeoxyribonuclease RuvC [Cytobacillus oceanisediminis]
MYFLGLDPSTKCTGFCLMDENKDIIEKGKIDISKIDDHGEKLAVQYKVIESLMDKYEITKVLCEDQYAKLNIDTVKKLSRTTGIYLLMAKLKGVELELIYPTSWRKVFHGYGSAKKEDTFDKVVAIYELEGLTFKKDNDMTDSVGIAWACVDMHKGVAA